MAVGTADAGKAAARVAAVQVALDHLLDNGPEEAILLLKANFIIGQEPVEVMEQHPIKDSPLGMSRTINPCHSRSFSSGNGPSSWIRPRLPEKMAKIPTRKPKSKPESVNRRWLPVERNGNDWRCEGS